MTSLTDAMRGMAFFARFSPSFTRPGLQARRILWGRDDWQFDGQTWLVSGATGGIGRAVVLAALKGGARVIALARSPDKLAQLQQDAAGLPGGLDCRQVDLSLKADVARLAADLAGQGICLDVLVNNVGILNNDWRQTGEGHEQSYATNLLNQHLLSKSLLDNDGLQPDAVVINVVSGGLYMSNRNLERLDQAEDGFDGVAAYAAHKRGQLALVDHYRQQYRATDRHFYAMHPGWVDTAGVQTSLPGFRALYGPVLRQPEDGADTILWLAANRPQDHDDRVWFDRAEREAHYFRATRQADVSVAALVDYLDRDLDGVPAQDKG